jgi:hypothetical protein
MGGGDAGGGVCVVGSCRLVDDLVDCLVVLSLSLSPSPSSSNTLRES